VFQRPCKGQHLRKRLSIWFKHHSIPHKILNLLMYIVSYVCFPFLNYNLLSKLWIINNTCKFRLTHATYFTVIDLTSGYFQVPLDPASRSCTAFMCSKGTFQFNLLPMGVTNAVETYQRCFKNFLSLDW